MRIIISESQYRLLVEDDKINKHKEKLKRELLSSIETIGFNETLRKTGLSITRFLNIIDYDITNIPLYYLFPLLVDEIKPSPNKDGIYRDCEIVVDWYDENDYGVYWVSPIKDVDKEQLTVVTFAFPDFNKGEVYVENGHCYTDDTYNNMRDYNVKTIKYDIPTHFEDDKDENEDGVKVKAYDKFKKWFYEKYLPITYYVVVKQGDEIVIQLTEKDLI